MGPLSSFSQRIAIAYAFGLIPKQRYRDFELIRKIRNHFAHHPMDTTFATAEVQKLAAGLSMMDTASEQKESRPGYRARIAYLLTCGISCGSLLDAMEKAKANAKKDV
jgi:DNA-binding MltR family transcriptional regulator